MTPTQITSLTPKQEQEKLEWRKRYFDIGWSTQPSDRARAERGMISLYKREGLKAPEFLWLDSPLAAARVIKESTGASVTLSGVDGQIDAYWLAFYTFCLHIGAQADPDDVTQLGEWADIIESTGPCYPYTKICIMTERPIHVSYDEQGLLHGEGCPALEYRDGYKLFVHHNVPVPELVAMRPWEITMETIESEQNSDVQTIMQSVWCHAELDSTGRNKGAGGGRWLQESGAKTLHMDTYMAYRDEVTGEDVSIYRALIEDKLGRKFLMCPDSSTDRIYYIQVDPESTTCEEGHMSVNGGIPDRNIRVSA